MRHIQFVPANTHQIALLVKASAFNHQEILSNYAEPLVVLGVPLQEQIAFTLDYDEHGKAPVAHIKAYLGKLLPGLVSLGIQYLYVTDAAYFKVLTKEGKAEPHFGYVLPCKLEGFTQLNVVLGLNYQQLIYNPDLQSKLDLSLQTLASHVQGNYQALGANIIHSASYPETTESIAAALKGLLTYPSLTCDIETRSLRFQEAGIETIAFGLDKHNGIAFCVEKGRSLEEAVKIKMLLKEFFISYKGKLIYHNSTYDIQVIIFELWMKNYENLQELQSNKIVRSIQ